MDDPKPDNIQSQPPERWPEEIQAGRTPPCGDDPALLPDYDFKKPGAWWPTVTAIVFFIILICGYIAASGKVVNKTFSCVAGPCGASWRPSP
jgi:hypothetical protein